MTCSYLKSYFFSIAKKNLDMFHQFSLLEMECMCDEKNTLPELSSVFFLVKVREDLNNLYQIK